MTVVKNAYIKEPAYFSKFHCLGDKCPYDCCHHWRIDWTKEDVERLKNANCSEKLKGLIDTSFDENSVHENMLMIKRDKVTGACPFLEKGLCSIQKELGTEYFSAACNDYPRISTIAGSFYIRSCYISCYAVLDLICGDENSMEMLTKHHKEETLNGKNFFYEDKLNHPQIEFFGEISTFFTDILADRTHSLETSIVLGALAAKMIDKYIDSKKTDQIPKLLAALKQQLKDPAQIAKLESVKPNYNLKLGFGKGFIEIVFERIKVTVIENNKEKTETFVRNFIGNIIDADSGKISEKKFIEGERKFLEAFAGRSHVIRNIALNIFITGSMPFKDENFSIYENYCCFVGQMSAVKMIAAVAGYEGDTAEKIEEIFKNTLVIAARIMCHNSDYLKIVTDLMKTYGCTSPAHLAYILK